jgi:hypothetical protein
MLLVLPLKKCSNIRSYECVICFDNITPRHTREHSLWHCKECYRVIHLLCVKEWYKGNGAKSTDATLRIAMSLPIRWSCPHCTHHIVGLLPTPSCWCGKQSFDFSNIASGRPNACIGTCDRIGQCGHGGRETRCQKLCHPGPCNIPCTEACANTTLLQPPRPPNVWNRLCTRFCSHDPGIIRIILLWSAVLAILYGGFSVLLFYYIKWWMSPYEYYHKANTAETIVACVGILVVLPLTAFLCFMLCGSIADFLVAAFNLDSRESNREVKVLTKFLGTVLLVGFCAVLWALPIIG